MIDRSVMVNVLTTLKSLRDVAGGTEQNQLMTEINILATQPLTSALLREHFQYAQDRGWISSSRGQLNDVRLRITPAGVGALSDLQHGG